MASLRGLSGSVAVYAATKAAVASLGEGLRSEFCGTARIAVTTVFPGYIKTAMTDGGHPSVRLARTARPGHGSNSSGPSTPNGPKAYIPTLPWAVLSVPSGSCRCR